MSVKSMLFKTPKPGRTAREALEAAGFKRAGVYLQGGKVFSEDFFDDQGMLVVLNYTHVRNGTGRAEYHDKRDARGLSEGNLRES